MKKPTTLREEWNNTYPAQKLNEYGSVFADDEFNWWLQKHREAIAEERERYNELIMAVESKHEGETRHETALRYIKQAQQGSNQALTQE